jgi:16S rRNA (guanine527-N7)-methyltransferase
VHDHKEGALDRPRDPLPTRVHDLPPLPAAFDDVLEAGLEALGLRLEPTARAAIDGHARLLLAWTAAINLTAIRDPEAVARLHVLDSLAAVPLLAARGVTGLLDLGSGGGYPGLPLAAVLEPERVLLVDSVAKKVGFLRVVVEATGLEGRVAAEAVRAEMLARDARDREGWPVVVSRAAANLPELVEIGLPLVAPGGILVAWKRASVVDELPAARLALHVLRAGPVTVHEVPIPGLEDHRLVVIPRGGPLDPQYPRDPAERKRRPL